MIKIITKNKSYIWNYKRFGRNLWNVIAPIAVLIMYLIVSTMEYNDLIK